MTPEQAVLVIQNAWRAFVDDRRSEAYAEHMEELNATYYSQCYGRAYYDSEDEW